VSNSVLAAVSENRTAIEAGFPTIEVSQVAEAESWRKEINRPATHIHKWWATRLGSVFRAVVLGALRPEGAGIWEEYYQPHRLEGRVVLDPFMGSGTTLMEALKLGASVVGCDVNPVSSFLVKQALTRVDEVALDKAFLDLDCGVGAEIRSYYATADRITGQRLPVMHYFWVKVVRTPSGEDVPLFSSYVFAKDAYPSKKPIARLVSPCCWEIFSARYDSELEACPSCGQKFNPQSGPADGQYVTDSLGHRFKIKDLVSDSGEKVRHRMYAVLAVSQVDGKVYLKPDERDFGLYAEASRRLATEDLPLPVMPVRRGHNTDQARGYNYTEWRDFFNDRQLLCLGLLLRAIQRIEVQGVRDQMVCLFSSVLEFNNMFCSFKGEGTGAVRHMFSNHILKPERTPLENCIWGEVRGSGTFSALFESRLKRAKRYLDEPFEVSIEGGASAPGGAGRKVICSAPLNVSFPKDWTQLSHEGGSALILNGDSGKLPVPDEVVDAVVTDPPYFDFVHYSELSDFFFAWLAPSMGSDYPFFRREDSSSPHEVQQKDPKRFAHQLGRVLAECRRVLKPSGVVAFSFHHSRPEGWAAIALAIAESGLVVTASHPVHGELRGANPKSATKDPISLDAILVCRKGIVRQSSVNVERAMEEARSAASALREGGLTLSGADEFVIAAGHLLTMLPSDPATYESLVGYFAALRPTR
jgi:putative DNA methylase